MIERMKPVVGRRGLRSLALLATLAMVIAACGDGSEDTTTTEAAGEETTTTEAPAEETTTTAAEGGDIKVGYISLGESVPFVKLVSDGIREQAEAAGVDLVFCDSEVDAATALECARQFAVEEVDGVLNFQVFQESSPEICAAHGDVPVIAIDIVQEPCQTAFMGADNREAGRLAGAAVGEYFAENFDCEYDAYVSLESTAAGAANTDRMGGYREGFEEHCEILNETILDGADRTDPAQEQVTNLLTSLPGERIVVVAINEDGIIGAIAAANTLGRSTDLYYSGQGTDPSIWCEIVNNPNYVASTAYFPERYSELLIPNIIAAINGEDIPAEIYVEHEVITSENIGDIYDVSDC